MTWRNPLPGLTLRACFDPESFRKMGQNETGVPVPPHHPGSFGFKRKHHVHEGVDLYCPPETPVHAVEDGEIVTIEHFTGPKANSPWWHDTQAVLVRGASGVVAYGEVRPLPGLSEGMRLQTGQMLGHVIPVLTKDKGRPMTMLHLELHTMDARKTFEWAVNGKRPVTLRDPTMHLLKIAKRQPPR